MDGKVLLFIRDYQLKRIAINCVAQLKIQFMECMDMDELDFKLQLFETGNRLYIHEFSKENEEKQFLRLKSIREKGWTVLVIFPEYLIRYIDEGQKVGINDMLVHPVEPVPLKNKIVSLLSLPIIEPKDELGPSQRDNYLEAVKLEINRAERGKYALSFVMVYFGSVAIEKHQTFFELLSKKLRETDVVLSTNEKNTYILLCPFTSKNFVVEVENKARQVFAQMKDQQVISPISKLYVHGLTLGTDGSSFGEIYEHLVSSIHDSKLLDQSFVQNLLYDPEKLKAYRSMFKRI